MLSYNVALDQAPIVGLLKRFAPAEQQRRMHAAMTESVQLGMRRVVSRMPKKTGALMGSVGTDSRVESAWRGVVASGLPYAVFVELNTKPHIIRPRNAKAIFWKGAAHPMRWKNPEAGAKHPGTKGHHMFEKTAAEMGPLVGAIFARRMGEP